MLMKVFSIFDEKAKCFGPLWPMKHNGEALREFSDITADKNGRIGKHPEDFKLYSLGTYDDNSGALSPVAQPEFIAHATDFIENNTNKN